MNHINLIGTLARNPEFHAATGTAKARYSATLAGETVQMGKDGPKTIPFYHRIQAFGQLAELLADRGYLAGDPIMVQGQLRDERWTGSEGQKMREVRVSIGYMTALAEATINHQDASGAFRMAGGMNNAELRGNLTEDAILRYAPSGDAVLNLSVAVNEKYRGKDGQTQERTDYFQVSLWGQQAEALSRLTKGTPVFIMGALSDYHDKEKVRRFRIDAHFIQPLFRMPQASQPEREEPTQAAAVPHIPRAQSAMQNAVQPAPQPAPQAQADVDDVDDSLPDLDAPTADLPAMPAVKPDAEAEAQAEAQAEVQAEVQAESEAASASSIDDLFGEVGEELLEQL